MVKIFIYAVPSVFSFSSSPSDAEFDAVVGYLEDIIMGKLCKWCRQQDAKHTQAALLLAAIQKQNSPRLLPRGFPPLFP